MIKHAVLCAIVSTAAFAVDGVILIDQSRALAGNVTPGDAPGFPVTISQPGSYRLSGNLLVGTSNVSAIQIAASNVTLDLNGFGASCTLDTSTLFCIGTVAGGALAKTAVRNGRVHIVNTAAVLQIPFAVSLLSSTSNMLTDLRIQMEGGASGSLGLVTGMHSIIRGNIVSGSGAGGSIICPSLIEGNVNAANGLLGTTGSGCVSVNNAGFGF